MLIGKKLNLLIIGVISAIFVSIAVFAAVYIPVVEMRDEKDSMLSLDSAIIDLRAEINKLGIASFSEQIIVIKEKSDVLVEQFNKLEHLDRLSSDEEIARSLKIIGRLYGLYEENYEELISIAEPLIIQFEKIFLSSRIRLDEINQSMIYRRADNIEEVEMSIDSVKTSITVLDSNLISTHTVVDEQFHEIDNLIDARERAAYISGIILVIMVGIIAFIFAVTIASRIVRDLRIAASGIKKMSDGDITESFSVKSRDEIGQLCDNLNVLSDSLKSAFRSMKASSFKGIEVKEELITSAEQTSSASSEIAANSQAISRQFSMLNERVEGAAEVNRIMMSSLQSLESYVQDQTAMVEESTSAVTEMISSINNVNDITLKKRAATDTLVKTAETGGKKLTGTIRVINEINESLDQIKGAATIIQQIASQTNLLAMNAAIEAAHAGDAGRGFAVVADEIRKLAEASSVNSKQINGVIKEVVNRIEVASASGHETEEAFVEIDREVEGVAESLDEISSSMGELNVGGKQILEAMTGLQDVSVNVNQGSKQMAEASDKVTDAIEVVSRITNEVSSSAGEITVGITEVSGAMMLVTELSGTLGEITALLETEAGRFRTDDNEISPAHTDENCEVLEENDSAEANNLSAESTGTEASGAPGGKNTVSSGDATGVTISGDDTGLEIESIDEE
ncbi:MAG: HAMP domain-containing methyl-accepting chemotaxis protein [Spirochaetales bacterium]|uniref:HAMP domain-containing methyl-accepting chemotaxis protein n=1 Tax=Candidatus Thalassospirochaeta sargassi TaxID=3119039 RepID=A0AAJ1IJH5_9SPIO|nr:HAMP domain-containing methyl-accepting chemotaxis protein [Spirochaetales bacterium]